MQALHHKSEAASSSSSFELALVVSGDPLPPPLPPLPPLPLPLPLLSKDVECCLAFFRCGTRPRKAWSEAAAEEAEGGITHPCSRLSTEVKGAVVLFEEYAKEDAIAGAPAALLLCSAFDSTDSLRTSNRASSRVQNLRQCHGMSSCIC